ncbi:hypothetical protein BCV70DRAFT_238749 [Testicularia cyperi]|uniref:DUF3752 domain-containing protein n=1 Tax=Testicularia cyperi TaxID=1882483 RepID=A0A317XIW2_9BASI|nr:hypothetical protein BCV70DRAFT_238749 [Testicularia cyperi]
MGTESRSRPSRSRSESFSSASSYSSYSSGSRSRSRSRSPSRSRSSLQKTVAGPSLPPGFRRDSNSRAEEQQVGIETDNKDDDVDDDDVDDDDVAIGPLLPVAQTADHDNQDGLNAGARAFMEREARRKAAQEEAREAKERAAKSRPEWMLLPPSLTNSTSLQAVAGDPLNLKSRGFAQTTPRVSARGSGPSDRDTDTSLWTETPKERVKRLQQEASGARSRNAGGSNNAAALLDAAKNAQRDRAIAESLMKSAGGSSRDRDKGKGKGKDKDKGKSLVEEHQERRREELRQRKEDEDRQEQRRRQRRRRERQDDDDDPSESRRQRSRRSDENDTSRRDRHRDSGSSRDDRRSSRHRGSRDDKGQGQGQDQDRGRGRGSSQDERRRRRRREQEEKGERERERERERRRTKTRKEREEAEVREGKAAAPMMWDRDAALGIGAQLMDEKKRARLVSDANALQDRFGSGSRRFL